MQTYFQMQVSPRPSHMWSFSHLLTALLLGLLLFRVSCDFVETVLKEVQGETQIGLLVFFLNFLRHWSRLSLVSILVPKTCRWCFSSDMALRNNVHWKSSQKEKVSKDKDIPKMAGSLEKVRQAGSGQIPQDR